MQNINQEIIKKIKINDLNLTDINTIDNYEELLSYNNKLV
jgi:hypothetical protein